MTRSSKRQAAVDVIAHAVECVAAMAAVFPDARVSEETVAGYARSLMDLPPELLERAVARCIATCDFFPRVAQIRAAAIEEDNRYPLAIDAWGEVERAFGQYGRDRLPHWSHPLIAQAVNRIGWHRLCQANPDVIRGQFDRSYKELLERARTDRMARPVVEGTRLLPLAAKLAAQLAGRAGDQLLLGQVGDELELDQEEDDDAEG